MASWRFAIKRAAKAAAKDARIDSVVAAVSIVLGQAILSAVIFFGLGSFTSADLWVRVATALVPFLLFPVAFLIRLFVPVRAPPNLPPAPSPPEPHSRAPEARSAFIRSKGNVILKAKGSRVSGFEDGIDSESGEVDVTLEDTEITGTDSGPEEADPSDGKT